MFLSTFLSRMIIRHRSEITHLNANELSRLSSDSVDFESTLERIEEIEKSIFEMPHEEHTKVESNVVRIAMSVTIIKDIDDFLDRVVKKLKIDDVFKKIYAHLQKQVRRIAISNEEVNILYQFYRLDLESRLLYLVNRSKSNRLCILKVLQKEILEYAHDKHAHDEMHRTYDLLRRSVFILKMKRLVSEYVLFCLVCQLSKSSRQLSYEKLHSIDLSEESLVEINIDFIVTLLKTTNNFNALLTVTDRFFKFVLLIAGRENLSAQK
jgi:hypothetical protein